MNSEIEHKMRDELANAKKGFGLVVGIATYFLLISAAFLIPGLDVLMKTHDWPAWVIIILSFVVGSCAGSARFNSHRRKIDGYDIDTLKYEHDQLERKKLKSNIIFYIIIALVVAYFVFRK